jgi:hypothetical protein
MEGSGARLLGDQTPPGVAATLEPKSQQHPEKTTMTTLGLLRKWLLESAKVLASNAPFPIAGLCTGFWDLPQLIWLGLLYLLGCRLWYWHRERMADKRNQEAEKVRGHSAVEAEKVRVHERDMLTQKQTFQHAMVDKLLSHGKKLTQPIAVDLTVARISFRIGGKEIDLLGPLAGGRAA